jgi:colicin import membrane protein
VAAEGARPILVVEVTSTGTRQNDFEIKPDFYHRARVPRYVIADAVEEDEETRRVELIAYRYAPAGYERVAPDARGWIPLDPLGLWLGVVQDPELGCDRLACFDATTGEEIGDYRAISQALEAATAAHAQAEARAEAEAPAREHAETKAHAEVTAREQAEAKAHAEVTARAQAEARARAEATAREQAEARVRELEEAIRRLGQGA